MLVMGSAILCNWGQTTYPFVPHVLSFNMFTTIPSLHTSHDTYKDKMELTHKHS